MGHGFVITSLRIKIDQRGARSITIHKVKISKQILATLCPLLDEVQSAYKQKKQNN